MHKCWNQRIDIYLQKTGTNIKVYSECCPESTERIVAIAGKPEPVVNCIDTIFELLETVSHW